MQAGERFTVRGAFSVQVASAGADSAALSFRWTDRTRPARPSLLRPERAGGRITLRWRRGVEAGSGLWAHDVLVGRRRVVRVPGVRRVYSLALRLARGEHRVGVVAVDRAGNRSRPASRVVSVR